MRMDRQTDMTKLTVVFPNFLNAPKMTIKIKKMWFLEDLYQDGCQYLTGVNLVSHGGVQLFS